MDICKCCRGSGHIGTDGYCSFCRDFISRVDRARAKSQEESAQLTAAQARIAELEAELSNTKSASNVACKRGIALESTLARLREVVLEETPTEYIGPYEVGKAHALDPIRAILYPKEQADE